ncbi:hypothetical protein Athena1_0044 [Vibrio phage Athena1]|nr:hypothetical protein Athena1_0044 [Vibrio phage Athena1]
MNREELEKEAKSLNIKFDGRTTDQKLSEKIQTAKLSAKMSSSKNTENNKESNQDDKDTRIIQDENPEPEKTELVEVVNCHNGLWQLPDGTCIKAGSVGGLTKEQLETPQVQRAIETGFLKVK